MDKMKAQAAQLAQKAQEAGKAGQSKIGDVQAKRRADGLLRELGAAVYAQRAGHATSDTAGDIDRLVAELSTLESENGPLDVSDAGTPAGDATSEPEDPPEGGFTL
ncbi:MAG TPA: hypothetical protein VNF05_02415 [Acidimicrobiales bacterium]|nr:hypothetical protein [Acidimicrobiales bacterium]